MLIQVAPNSLEGTESSSTTHRMPWCYVKHMAKPADPAARVHRNGDFGSLFATIPFADPAGFGFCATLAWQVTRRAAKQEIRSYLDRHLNTIKLVEAAATTLPYILMG